MTHIPSLSCLFYILIQTPNFSNILFYFLVYILLRKLAFGQSSKDDHSSLIFHTLAYDDVYHFSNNHNNQVFQWNDALLEKLHSYKYLGVWFNSNGKFVKNRLYVTNQAKKAMFSLSIIKHLCHPPIPVILHLYELMLKPIMCYGSEVWGFDNSPDVERIELKFLKFILHLPFSVLSTAVGGD